MALHLLRALLCLGVLYTAIFAAFLPHNRTFAHDGQLLYVAGSVLAHGGDPYDLDRIREGFDRYTPDDGAAGIYADKPINPPGVLGVFAVLNPIPYRAYLLLQVALSAFCIPWIAFLCLPDNKRGSLLALTVASAAIAILPTTWQIIVLGQITLPILLLVLVAWRASQAQRFRPVGLCVFAALLKATVALPFAVRLLFRDRISRAWTLAAIGGFVALNAAAVGIIGPQRATEGYRSALSRSFGPGGVNEPGNDARIDLAELTCHLGSPALSTAAQWLLTGLCIALVVWAFRGRKRVELDELAALCILSLLLFYHRTYDAALLIPAGFLVYRKAREGNTGFSTMLLGGALLAAFATIGSHSVVNLIAHGQGEMPGWIRPAFILVAYLGLVAGSVHSAPLDQILPKDFCP